MLGRASSVVRGVIAIAVALSLVVLGASPASAYEGEQDPTFPTNLTTDISGPDHGNALALQPNGRIVVAGSTTGSGLDTAIVRYTPAGALDSTFDGDGVRVVPVGSGDDQANGVAIAPDGKIVMAGYVAGGQNDTMVVRLNGNGSLDSTFDNDGVVVTPVVPFIDNVANDVAVQPDGKVVIVGTARNGNDADFEIVRYRTNGMLDPTFDSDGILTLDLGGSTDRANAVAIQEDGRILVAGSSFDLDPARFVDEPTLVRLLPTGASDPSFGTAGVRRIDNGAGALNAVTFGEGGRIVAAGFSTFSGSDFVLTATYPANGSSVEWRTLGNFQDTRASGVALQPDGKIVVSTADGCGCVARFLPDLAQDPTWASGGLSSPPAVRSGDANGIAIADRGRILVAGTDVGGSAADFGVARLIGDQTPPWGARMIGVPRYSLVNSRTVSWTASDIGTGVAAFDVQRRQASFDGSPFSAFTALVTNTPNAFGTVTGSPGNTVCLRVRGRDFAGNIGVYGEQSCEAIPLDERAMTATGSWTNLSNSVYYRGTAMSSTTAGSKLAIHGTYRHLAVVVTRCSVCGTLKVFRGTTLLRTVNLSSLTTMHQQIIVVDSPLTQQSDTISLTQASAGKKIVIEGLAVSRT